MNTSKEIEGTLRVILARDESQLALLGVSIREIAEKLAREAVEIRDAEDRLVLVLGARDSAPKVIKLYPVRGALLLVQAGATLFMGDNPILLGLSILGSFASVSSVYSSISNAEAILFRATYEFEGHETNRSDLERRFEELALSSDALADPDDFSVALQGLLDKEILKQTGQRISLKDKVVLNLP